MEKYAQELIEKPVKADLVNIESCNAVYDEKDKQIKMDIRMTVNVSTASKDEKELLCE